MQIRLYMVDNDKPYSHFAHASNTHNEFPGSNTDCWTTFFQSFNSFLQLCFGFCVKILTYFLAGLLQNSWLCLCLLRSLEPFVVTSGDTWYISLCTTCSNIFCLFYSTVLENSWMMSRFPQFQFSSQSVIWRYLAEKANKISTWDYSEVAAMLIKNTSLSYKVSLCCVS